jgi:hypothetical protein
MSRLGEFYQRDRTLHPPALTPCYKTSVSRSPQRALLSLQQSLSEITGTVFGPGDVGALDNDLILNYAQDGDPMSRCRKRRQWSREGKDSGGSWCQTDTVDIEAETLGALSKAAIRSSDRTGANLPGFPLGRPPDP